MNHRDESTSLLIYGRNPLIEALREHQPIEKIYLLHHLKGGKIDFISREARRRGIPVTRVDRRKLESLTGAVNHQGVAAIISPVTTLDLDTFLDQLRDVDHPPCVVMLDRIQDPHNMGAILRSSEFLGADGVIYSPRENVPLNETVIKTSAGALFHLLICKVSNLVQAIQRLKEEDYWIYGSHVNSTTPLWTVDFTRKCVIVIGNEEHGMRPLVEKNCDQLFFIPRIGKTNSLNASVAAGIALAECLRQRQKQ
ncbi:MAG: 23S rRNA (guanosine(2251)-2'-O)-methyltransferase RlmB [Calditrichaeota bacterium]|nr:23S rRNA (guanosine(2251)-2'-O)-methyltransferase RlmB [Calditrichota bacterium]